MGTGGREHGLLIRAVLSGVVGVLFGMLSYFAAAQIMLGLLEVIYALSDFLIMILSWLVKQSLRAFLFQEVQL